MKAVPTLALFAAASLAAAGLPKGELMPTLRGEFLTGKAAQLPEAASGKVALVAVGFTYDSRFAVEDWVKRFRGDFGSNPKVTFFEVPVVGGMAKMGKWFIDSGMRKGTPKEDHEHVITAYSGAGEWKSRLGYKDGKAAYLILLDADGKVRWQHTGGMDEAAYRKLADEVRGLL